MPEEAKREAEQMDERPKGVGLSTEESLIQQMIKDAFETFVLVIHDQSFGPVITCGA
jgi:acyl-CoA synthetase (NDP forming)